MGIMFPTMDNTTACGQGILNIIIATGILPRNSMRGIMEMISTINTGLKPLPFSQVTVLSAKELANKGCKTSNSSRVISIVLKGFFKLTSFLFR
jgi:hypothetical protein